MGNPWRSALFIPATERFLAGYQARDADVVIFDLEDSVVEEDKEAALVRLTDFLKSRSGEEHFFVRVNKSRAYQEISVLNALAVEGYMLPKAEKADELLEMEESLGGKKVIALVETPLGILNVKEIASCHMVDILAFGAEDFTCAMNMENTFTNIQVARNLLLMAAKAYGKPALDTPSFNFKEEGVLAQEIQAIAGMGFTGKLAIHPAQIAVINKGFALNDMGYIRSVVRRFEEADQGVQEIDGVIYEMPHIKRFKKILAENQDS